MSATRQSKRKQQAPAGNSNDDEERVNDIASAASEDGQDEEEEPVQEVRRGTRQSRNRILPTSDPPSLEELRNPSDDDDEPMDNFIEQDMAALVMELKDAIHAIDPKPLFGQLVDDLTKALNLKSYDHTNAHIVEAVEKLHPLIEQTNTPLECANTLKSILEHLKASDRRSVDRERQAKQAMEALLDQATQQTTLLQQLVASIRPTPPTNIPSAHADPSRQGAQLVPTTPSVPRTNTVASHPTIGQYSRTPPALGMTPTAKRARTSSHQMPQIDAGNPTPSTSGAHLRPTKSMSTISSAASLLAREQQVQHHTGGGTHSDPDTTMADIAPGPSRVGIRYTVAANDTVDPEELTRGLSPSKWAASQAQLSSPSGKK